MQKARLVELTDDDRATLLGAFLSLADQLRGNGDADDDPHALTALWRRRGLRAFDAEATTAGQNGSAPGHPKTATP